MADNYIPDVTATWSGTGVVMGRLAPTSGVSTTFTAETAGEGTIEADAGGIAPDVTVAITVTQNWWIIHLPAVMR